MRPVNLTLDEQTVADARTLGEGSVSQGIRRAVAEAIYRLRRRIKG